MVPLAGQGMPDPQHYLFDFPRVGRPEPFAIPEEWYPGIKRHWAKSTSSRVSDPLMGIRTVVIHATAGVSSEGAMSVMKAHKASWHWVVPDESESQHGHFVWACVPEARAARHVRNSASHPQVNEGGNRTNHTSLAIAIVNSRIGRIVEPFSNWQVAATAQIARYCWAKYPNVRHVVSHAALDPSRKSDPGPHFPWDEFKTQVLRPSLLESVNPLVAETTHIDLLPGATSADGCCAPAAAVSCAGFASRPGRPDELTGPGVRGDARDRA